MASALAGRVALITGGASGIGLATARRLRATGATVAIADLHWRGPAEHAELAVVADVGDPEAWPPLLERVERELGRLDIVHLNAGVIGAGPDLTATSDETYRRVMRVNVDHVFFGLRAAAALMERHGGGRIVVTASLAGIGPFAADPVYTATKHAVVGLVRSCAANLAARGVVVTAVCPGIVDTPLLREEDHTALLAAAFPLLSAEDIADAVVRVLEEGTAGACWYVQPGREPAPFEFRGVPGPRVPGTEGMRPPV